jgi:hypothetical protein
MKLPWIFSPSDSPVRNGFTIECVSRNLLFLWNTRAVRFYVHSLHTRFRLQGHNVIRGDFRNTSVCFCSCLHSRVMQTMLFFDELYKWAFVWQKEHFSFSHRPSTCCSFVSSSSAFTTRSSQLHGLGETRLFAQGHQNDTLGAVNYRRFYSLEQHHSISLTI